MTVPLPHDDLLREVTARATSDAAFREELLTDPGEAILRTFGVRLPPGYRLRFIERPPEVDRLIVLPDPPDDGELGDDALDSVAGGDGGDGSW